MRTVFIDLAKVFDHTDHSILMGRLSAFSLHDVIIRCMYSFLKHRCQRVKIGDFQSDWLEVFAGMPQVSFLGPLTFIILIDSIRAACLTHKFVDDTTWKEILDKTAVSQMQQTVNQSTSSRMNVNGAKMKEMLINPIAKHPPSQLSLDGATVDRVTTFKPLVNLGVHVANGVNREVY